MLSKSFGKKYYSLLGNVDLVSGCIVRNTITAPEMVTIAHKHQTALCTHFYLFIYIFFKWNYVPIVQFLSFFLKLCIHSVVRWYSFICLFMKLCTIVLVIYIYLLWKHVPQCRFIYLFTYLVSISKYVPLVQFDIYLFIDTMGSSHQGTICDSVCIYLYIILTLTVCVALYHFICVPDFHHYAFGCDYKNVKSLREVVAQCLRLWATNWKDVISALSHGYYWILVHDP